MADYIIQNFDKILVNRQGVNEDSYMKTTDLLGHVETNNSYLLEPGTLTKVRFPKRSKSGTGTRNNNKCRNINTTILKNQWLTDNKVKSKSGNANILGPNVEFVVDREEVHIPVTETTEENLSYFGARLLKHGDTITIDTPYPIPITVMDIGKNYVNGFLLESGSGCYLEYHDTPHLHMPMNSDANGHIILAKVIDGDIHLTAFTIPYGYACYTLPYTIHCDAFLVGKYIVLYTVTPNYSTALLRHAGKSVKVSIVE